MTESPDQLRDRLRSQISLGGEPYATWIAARDRTPRLPLERFDLSELRVKYDPANPAGRFLAPDVMADLWALLDVAEALVGVPREAVAAIVACLRQEARLAKEIAGEGDIGDYLQDLADRIASGKHCQHCGGSDACANGPSPGL